MNTQSVIAYFSMEIGLEAGMPTYSGGLGVLAGDTIRSAADLKVPMVAVTLLHRKGYFYQRLDAERLADAKSRSSGPSTISSSGDAGRGSPSPSRAARSSCGPGRYEVNGVDGFVVPVYLARHRPAGERRVGPHADRITSTAATSSTGSARRSSWASAACGCCGPWATTQIERFHMNEGHAGPADAGTARRARAKPPAATAITTDDIEAVRQQCVFTTHTPGAGRARQVPAGPGRPRARPLRGDDRVQGCVLLRRRAEHDLPGAEPEPLRQRRGQEARRGLAPHVRRLPDRLDHQRRARRHLDLRRRSRRSSTATSPAGARTTSACAMR